MRQAQNHDGKRSEEQERQPSRGLTPSQPILFQNCVFSLCQSLCQSLSSLCSLSLSLIASVPFNLLSLFSPSLLVFFSPLFSARQYTRIAKCSRAILSLSLQTSPYSLVCGIVRRPYTYFCPFVCYSLPFCLSTFLLFFPDLFSLCFSLFSSLCFLLSSAIDSLLLSSLFSSLLSSSHLYTPWQAWRSALAFSSL